MAYRYTEDKIISLDYDELFKVVDESEIFKNSKIRDYYINKWVYLLKKMDRSEEIKKKFDEENLRFKRVEGYEPEYYYTEIKMGEFKFPIAFDVERMHEIIDNNKELSDKLIQECDVAEIFQLNSTVFAQKILGVKQLFCEDKKRPIYLCELHVAKKFSLVVDGNYRLNYAREKNKKSIKYYGLTQRFLVFNNLFLSDLDKLLYILNNELITLKQLRLRNIKDMTILSNSYIVTKEPLDFFEWNTSFKHTLKAYKAYLLKY